MQKLANDTPENFEIINPDKMALKEKVGLGLGGFVMAASVIYYGSNFAETTYELAKGLIEKI